MVTKPRFFFSVARKASFKCFSSRFFFPLFTLDACVCVCVSEGERESERERFPPLFDSL